MEKVSLPIKTKIAAWWMIVMIGGILIAISLPFCYFAVASYIGMKNGVFVFGIIFLVGSLISILPGFMLLKRKKIGWWWSITIEILIMAFIFKMVFNGVEVHSQLLFLMFDFLFPFILLLLDHKNFWKIAS